MCLSSFSCVCLQKDCRQGCSPGLPLIYVLCGKCIAIAYIWALLFLSRFFSTEIGLNNKGN